MLYHYTSFDSLTGICRAPSTDEGLCFWATRFDCFGDREEYKLGIRVIKRLLPELEKRLQPDRRIASSFEWDEILGNETLPFPYVVSFTDKKDNEYLWEHYACQGKGVVIALDDSRRIVNEYTKNYYLRKCLYTGDKSDADLFKEIEDEYFNAAFAALTGPRKELALAFLSANPQLFVAIVGRYLLSYVATRIKGEHYLKEQETRLILAAPRPEMIPMVDRFKEVFKQFSVDVAGYEAMMRSEKIRRRENGDAVNYQEVYLPGSVLKHIYVKDEGLMEQVSIVLRDKGFNDFRVFKI